MGILVCLLQGTLNSCYSFTNSLRVAHNGVDIHATYALKPSYEVDSDYDDGYSLQLRLVYFRCMIHPMCLFISRG